MEAEFLSLAQIVEVMQETTIGVRIVKSFNLEPVMRSRMHRAVSDVERRANTIAVLEAGTSPIMETLAGLAIAGVILVSGYLKGGERLEKRAAVVDFKVGKGRVILIGFRPQHRAQPHATFKLLWNALYLAGLERTEL